MTKSWSIIAIVTLVAMTITSADQQISDRMYLHTALGISCLKCPPGTYRTAHCTKEDHQAKCRPCDTGTFQMYHTVAESCEPCLEKCKTDRETLVLNCSATSNNVCVCNPGHYRLKSPNGLCIIHTACAIGMGVTEMGTADTDTKCEVCADGFFSPNKSLTQICQPCSQCKPGYKSNSPCPKDSDTKCVPENEEDSLAIIIGGVIGGVVCVLLIVFLLMCICARKGRGPKLFQKICSQGDSNDAENIAEKTPLSSIERPPNNNNGNGMTNGDLVDKPEPRNGCSTEDLPGVVTDKTLVGLSHELISPEWPFFFRHLIGPSADNLIDESIIDNKGVREQIYKLLIKWKHMRKDKATIDEIVSALKETDHADLAIKYSRRKSTDV